MRTFVLSVLLVMAAGCASPRQEPIQLPPTIPMPPMPPVPEAMKRQSIRAFAASSVVVRSVADTNSVNYGIVSKVTANYEGGAKGVAVRIQWNNWPDDDGYVIQKSANLVDWGDVVLSSDGGPSEVLIYDLEPHEFYRIKKVFSSP